MGRNTAGSVSSALLLGAGAPSGEGSGNASEAVLLADQTGTIVAANSAACDLLGRTERELCQLGLAGLAGGADPAPALGGWLHNGRAPFIRDSMLARGDGTMFSALVFVSATVDDDGTPLAHIIVREISEVQRAEPDHEEYRQRYEDLLKERAEEMREAASRVRDEADERRQAEERFRVLVEHSSDVILIVDAEAIVTYCSPSVERLTGYSQDEVTGRSADRFIEGEDLALIAALRSQSGSALPRGEGELRVRTKDGTLRWFGWAASNHLDDATIRGVVINARDITDRVLAERELRASEQRYRTLTEGSPDVIYVIGADQRIEYVNSCGAQQFGLPAEQLIGLPLKEIFEGETASRVTSELERVLATGQPYENESFLPYLGARWMNTRLVALRDDEGHITAMLGVLRDVTERRLAQEALAESERHYRSLFEDSPVALWEEDHSAVKAYLEQLVASGVDDIEAHLREHAADYQHCKSLIRTLDVNCAAVALYEASSREELIEQRDELYLPGQARGFWSFWAAAFAGRRTTSYEMTDHTLAGHTVEVMETGIVPPGHEENWDRIYIADVDVSERRRSEDLLLRYQLLFAEARDIMWFVRTRDGRIMEANAAAEAAYGYTRDELLQLDIPSLRPDDPRPLLEEQLRQAAAQGLLFETEHRRKDGSAFPVEVSTRGIVTVGGEAMLLSVIRDVTARKQTEIELARTTARLEHTVQGAVAALGVTAELRDPYTAGHQRRVAELACAIAAELGWDAGRVGCLRTAALLHDLGKIVVPAEILCKPGKLNEAEFLLIQQHAIAGAEILADIDFGSDVAAMVRQHHERLDGSGYPDGLKDSDILPEARVLAVADVVEAMVSHRPYRPGLRLDIALAEIENGSGRRYDTDVCAACARLMQNGNFTFELPE